MVKGILTDDRRGSVRHAIDSVTWICEKPPARYRARNIRYV
jgi:hypothetical protein